MTWWGTRKEPSPKMISEILRMNTDAPVGKEITFHNNAKWDKDFYWQVLSRELNTNGNYPFWLFSIIIYDDPRYQSSAKKWKLKIVYPSDYPYSEPRVTLPDEDIRHTPHVFNGTSDLCLWDHTNRYMGWDPAVSRGATCLLWSLQWIRGYLKYQRTGTWPHGVG